MDRSASSERLHIYTLGHSTRALAELVTLLAAFDVATVVDIRTVPRSRHNPQFAEDALRPALQARGYGYVHLPELGGLRRAHKDSQNLGWHNASFRGYADYMATEAFASGLNKLVRLASEDRVALMCAEAVPWRCHRSLVADALSVRGARVEHILGEGRSKAHRLTRFAEVDGERITYPESSAPSAT